jgi:branched-chain amino acid transport system substrate-binding protein
MFVLNLPERIRVGFTDKLHARLAEGPGGAAEMVPGQHHLRLNMYVGQVQGGQMKVIENLGVIDPGERVLSAQ